jgi:hypothetical protein
MYNMTAHTGLDYVYVCFFFFSGIMGVDEGIYVTRRYTPTFQPSLNSWSCFAIIS